MYLCALILVVIFYLFHYTLTLIKEVVVHGFLYHFLPQYLVLCLIEQTSVKTFKIYMTYSTVKRKLQALSGEKNRKSFPKRKE